MKRSLEIIVKTLIYGTFFVPILVVPSSFIFPFIVPKILLFRSLVTLMLGTYALLLIVNWEEYKPKFTALNLVMAAFLLSFTISTFVGSDAYHSFWDNHERMLGLFTIFHYIAYYFIATAVFKNWTDWKWALRVFLLAGSVVMVVSVFQRMVNHDLLLNMGKVKTASTLGNTIYVSGYGLFLFFTALLLYVKEKNNVVNKSLLALGALLAVAGLLFGGSRGTMLGFLAGLGVLLLSYLVIFWQSKLWRYAVMTCLAIVFASVILLFVFRQTPAVQNLPAIGPALNTSFAELKNSPRWIAWEIAVESWQERPLFGWGPNNYFYAFNKYYRSRSLEFGYGETWFDNAHNIIVNTLAVQGIFGIITYLGIFAVGFASLIYARRRNHLEAHIVAVGIAFLAAHLVGNITVFENPTSYLYFMFWLAFVNSLSTGSYSLDAHRVNLDVTARLTSAHSSVAADNSSSDRLAGFGVVGLVAAASLVAIFVFNIQPARANMSTLSVLRLLGQDPVLGILEMRKVLSLSSPHIDDIRSDIGRSAAQILYSSRDKLGEEKSKEIWQLVYTELKKNLTLHPLDIRNQLSLAQLAQTGADINQDNHYYLEAEGFLQDALRYSPRRQQIIYSLVGLKSMLGKGSEAVSMLEKSIVDDPKISEGYWRLALIHQIAGESDKALEVINRANANQIVWDEQGNNVVAQILLQQQQKKIKK